jgi:hypothetical protein
MVELPEERVTVKDFTALVQHLYHDVYVYFPPLCSSFVHDAVRSRPVDTAPLPAVSSILRATSDKGLRFPSIHALARERFRVLLEPHYGVANFIVPNDPEEALGLAVEHDIPSVRLHYTLFTLV